MKKVIFFDIDGTLVDVQRGLVEPSFYTKYAVKKLIDNGDIVIIATGRYKGNIDPSIKALNPSGYICANGAYIEYNGKVIFEEPIKKEYLDKLMDFCKENDCLFTCESSDIMYTPVFDDKTLDFIEKWRLSRDLITDDYGSRKYYKCNIDVGDRNKAKLFEDSFKDLFDCRIQTAGISGGYTYDVNLIGTNKGKAVSTFLELMNIDKDNTYCFCDGTNDLELVRACKYSYVMENGDESLKKIAYGVCGSSLDDGIYHKLVELNLIEKSQ